MRPSLPVIEPCESRRLMSVAASVGAGTLYVYGDDNANGILLTKSGSDIVVQHYVNGAYKTLSSFDNSKVDFIRIFARGGADTITIDNNVFQTAMIDGGLGADWIKGGGGKTYMFGNGQNAAIDDNAADSLFPGYGDTWQYGQGGDDLLHTSFNNNAALQGHDFLDGGAGKDRIYMGGARSAEAHGGFGDDTLIPGIQQMNFYGDDGTDTIDYSDDFYGAVVDLSGAEKSGYLDSPYDRSISLHGDVENVIGNKTRSNIIRGNYLNNRIVGGSRDDILEGRGGDDTIYGNDGADRIDGGENNDVLYGGKGPDIIHARSGNDTVYGGADTDYIFGESGQDKLYGEAGGDVIDGGADADWLVGGYGSDTLIDKGGDSSLDLFFGGNDDGTGNAIDYDTAKSDAGDLLLNIDKKV